MGSSEGKKPYKYPPRRPWKTRLQAIKFLLEIDGFVGESRWHGSRWAEWERRIRDGHEVEEKQIERIYNKRKKELTYDPRYDPAEWAGEDYMETLHLTNSMYAALVVGIWSRMEHFLQDVVRVCYQALDNREKALRKTQLFCQDSLARRRSKVTLKGCIKALKELQSDIPYNFDGIKEALKREVGVCLDQCTEYATVDATRILNNSFKHSKGRYEPRSGKSHTQIDKGLLKKWSILNDRKEIDYSKLPVKDLVVACSVFSRDLLGEVETALDNRTARRSGDGE